MWMVVGLAVALVLVIAVDMSQAYTLRVYYQTAKRQDEALMTLSSCLEIQKETIRIQKENIEILERHLEKVDTAWLKTYRRHGNN